MSDLLLVNKKAREMEHYGVPLPPPEYGPAFTAGERVLINISLVVTASGRRRVAGAAVTG